MSEMIERVAKAMEAADMEVPMDMPIEQMYRNAARAAIAAMREPTEAMINSPMARCYNDGPYADKEVRRIFSSMIDAALDSQSREFCAKR